MGGNFYLILPNIRSCHNVGAMFRTADAFGVDRVFLTGYTPRPPRKEIDKVALGAEKWIPWEHFQYLKPLIKRLKKKKVMIIGLEKNKTSQEINSLDDIKGDFALIVGNEVAGIAKYIQEMCDYVAHIPMLGKKESLNVSVAAGIAMHVLRAKAGLEHFSQENFLI